MTQPVRTEHDLLGDRVVPADAYYGIHTLRALENFPITGGVQGADGPGNSFVYIPSLKAVVTGDIMFDHVYGTPPPHLLEQREDLARRLDRTATRGEGGTTKAPPSSPPMRGQRTRSRWPS